MKKIMILNGPNLNMLGLREPDIYGSTTLDDVANLCFKTATIHKLEIDFRQTNSEGELVGWVQDVHNEKYDGLIINAAAYTHTSVALHDALKILDVPIAEVHISNPKERESFRHTSYVEPCAAIIICGKGVHGYAMAIEEIAKLL